MREIKFRAWREDLKEWVHKEACNILGEHILFGAWMDSVSIDNLNDVSVEQFIGLKDKNGTEIFEGDIVQRPDGVGRVGVVQFARGTFGINWDYKKNQDPEWRDGMMFGGWGALHNLRRLDDDFVESIEVIDNIHDNPELLKP